jgi:hypothetical protein
MDRYERHLSDHVMARLCIKHGARCAFPCFTGVGIYAPYTKGYAYLQGELMLMMIVLHGVCQFRP